MTRPQKLLVPSLVIIGLAGAWEIASHLVPKTAISASPMVPSFEFVFGHALKGLSNYWPFDAVAPGPVYGGKETWLGAALAVGYQSLVTWLRLLAGLACGAAGGVLVGTLLSLSGLVRRMFAFPVHVLRMFPLLAMVPLFQFWFGTSTWGVILFVAYGAGVVYLVGTINAISNVQARYIECALGYGASRRLTYRAVILPAVLPELASSVILTLGLSWTAVLAAEYIGVSSGLGYVLQYAEKFSFTGRMVFIAILVVVYAGASYALFGRIIRRAFAWMPAPIDTRARSMAATFVE